MATEKQIAANRQNARNSTGPCTEYGKRRSRRNAIRHGLTAETVIDVLEDPAAYKSLHRAIHADYRPRTNFELELVARLVSLLWRLRRSVAIESGIMSSVDKSLRKRSSMNSAQPNNQRLSLFYTLAPTLAPKATDSGQLNANLNDAKRDGAARLVKSTLKYDLARSFMRSSSLDGDVFERLGRYEIRLWRQVLQTILLLNSINRGAKEYADYDEKYFNLINGRAKHRRALWPPFVTSN
jgi:hypothetical protein